MSLSFVIDRGSRCSSHDYGKNLNVVEVGQVISAKYKLLRLLGDGGMGSVYEAEHLALGTHVAIKVLHTDLARRTGIAERFLQEARISAQIRSPHVVQVTDVDRTLDGVAYLVMELLQGEPLSGVVRRERRLAVGTACEYASQILQALEAAHSLGVIHRDLKPDNVFVTFQGGKPVLKLIDFGIAKLKTAQAGQTKNLTVAGMLMGTPEYMAPEQAYSADRVDVRADLYAVGVMLYEMLSGRPPVSADDPRVLVLKVERGEVTPLVQAAPGIEPLLAGLVHRSMAPRPEMRFANATEMRIALEDILRGRRPATAQFARAVVEPDPMAAAPAPPGAGNLRPMEIGTGTVMGAPVEGALTSSANVGSGPAPPMLGGGGTIGAPPIATPLYPHAYGPPPTPYYGSQSPVYEPTRPPRRKGSGTGLVVGLALVALLLGAGAVVAYVMTAQASTPSAPFPTFETVTPPLPTPSPSTPVPNVSVSVTPVAPLTPPPPAPNPNPNPIPAVKKDGGGSVPAHQDAGGPAPPVADAGGGQTTIVTPFGTFQFPGPRPLFYPPDQPWPPPGIQLPAPPSP